MKTYEHLNEKVISFTLDCGMEVHLLPKENAHFTYVELTVPFGSKHLNFSYKNKAYTLPAGTAHFFEHKIFAMPNQTDAFEYLTKLGMDANAFTSFNRTAYIFSTTDKLVKGLKYLLKMLDRPYFTQENIQAERQIINEEIKMNLDDHDSVIRTKINENLYFNNSIKHEVLGTLESIKFIDKEVLKLVWKAFYQPQNRKLVIGGKMDIEEIKSLLSSYDKPHNKMKEQGVIKILEEPEYPFIKEDAITLDISVPQLHIAYKLNGNKSAMKKSIILNIIGHILFSQSGELYELLKAEKIILGPIKHYSFVNLSEAQMVIYADTQKPKKLRAVISNFMDHEIRRVISPKEVELIKKRYIGQLIMSLDDLEDKVYQYANLLMSQENFFEVIDALKLISYEDILEVIKELNSERRSILFVHKNQKQ